MDELARRFWSKVKADGTGCFPWSAATDEWGYGRFNLNGKNVHAHRVAWQLMRGLIPNGLHVLHSCDRPTCCNVHHHFLGTNADNSADKVRKGRQSRMQGIDNPKAKLTEEQVRAIRASNETFQALAVKYGVHKQSIIYIKNRRNWRHL